MERAEKDMVQHAIAKLVQYALATKLIEKEDAVWAANRLLEVLSLDAIEDWSIFDYSAVAKRA